MKYLSLFLIFLLIPQVSFAGVNTHAGSFASASSQYSYKSSPTALPTGSAARSIIFWVKTTTASELYFIGYGSGSAAGAWDVTIDANLLSIRQNGGNRRWTATNINDGNWHKVAILYPSGANITGSTVDAYMDNVTTELADSSSASGVPNTTMGRISLASDCQSASCATPSVFADGSLDDVQVYNAKISTSSVLSAWDGCNLSDSATNLVGRWRMDNDWNDSTSNANHLTAVNSPTFTTSVAYSCSSPSSPAPAVMWID